MTKKMTKTEKSNKKKKKEKRLRFRKAPEYELSPIPTNQLLKELVKRFSALIISGKINENDRAEDMYFLCYGKEYDKLALGSFINHAIQQNHLKKKTEDYPEKTHFSGLVDDMPLGLEVKFE